MADIKKAIDTILKESINAWIVSKVGEGQFVAQLANRPDRDSLTYFLTLVDHEERTKALAALVKENKQDTEEYAQLKAKENNVPLLLQLLTHTENHITDNDAIGVVTFESDPNNRTHIIATLQTSKDQLEDLLIK